MFDHKLKAVDDDKAEYYRKVLENERASREQADKEIINLLHDVKNRYDTKLSNYMAKKNQKSKSNGPEKSPADSSSQNKNSAPNNSWGGSGTKNKTSAKDDEWGNSGNQPDNTVTDNDWGDSTNQPANNTSDNGWGDKGNQAVDNAADDSWGDSGNIAKDNATDHGWGDSAGQTNNADDDWGNSGGQQGNNATDSGWGDSGDQAKKVAEDDGWGDSGSKAKKDSPEKNRGNSKGKTKTSNTDNGWSDSAGKTEKNEKATPDNNQGDSNKNPKKNTKNKAKNQEATSPATNTTPPQKEDGDLEAAKNYKEVKSQLLTAKLDMRLLERDKGKLTSEVATLKLERDDLVRKLNQTNQDHDTMKVKYRGLTVDLVSANDEIRHLNERLDELEAQRRNRDRDASLSENQRRSLENKYKSFQQQIADLQSELSLVKEEKDEYAKRVSELSRRNERLERDLGHSKTLIDALKDGCTIVEGQAKTYEMRHDTVVMSKADLERELIAIKEESSRHITTINKLQKSNEHLSKAFIKSVEAHDECKKEIEILKQEYSRRLEHYKLENLRLMQANSQLENLIDYVQKKR